jgi:hypothetical protein
MRHNFSGVIGRSCAFVAALSVLFLSASTQAQKKESVWDKIKKAGQQGAQQGQPQQPTQPQQPEQRPSKPGQQPQGGGQNNSGPFKPPAGTKIEEMVLAPLQERASFEVSARTGFTLPRPKPMAAVLWFITTA